MNDFLKKKDDSHMLKHLEVAHPGQETPHFEFRVKASFKSALVRQVTEAVLIRRAGEATLNSKGVFNRCSLPRLVVESGKKEIKANSSKNIDVPEWQRWKKPKRTDNDQNRRPSKKLKLDPKDKKLVNPRYEGLVKRKTAVDSLEEFQNECKRMRPDFEPELESERQELLVKENSTILPNSTLFSTLKMNENSIEKSTPEIGLFSIFNKPSNSKKKQPPKRKIKLKPSSKLGCNKQQGGRDIRNFFTLKSESQGILEVVNQKQGTNLHNIISEDNEGLSQIRDNSDSNRARESGGVNLGTATKGPRAPPMLSTYAVLLSLSSEQGLID